MLDADPELARAWAVKELVRQLLATTTAEGFDTAWAAFAAAARAGDAPAEARALLRTLGLWRAEIARFCLILGTNARTEAAKLNAKNVKRAARGLAQSQQLPMPRHGLHTQPTAA